MAAMAELWQAMLDHAKTEFPEIWTEEERYVCVVWCMWGCGRSVCVCFVLGEWVGYTCR